MELWDVYDENLNKTGKTYSKGIKLNRGEYGYLVHIIIENKHGKFLLQQRSLKKEFYPGQWDATCGRVQAGENGIDGAMREVCEELGLNTYPEEYKCFYHKIYKSATLLDIFLLRKEFDEKSLVLQKDEVEKINLYSFDEMIKILTSSKDREYLDVLYEMKKHIGL